MVYQLDRSWIVLNVDTGSSNNNMLKNFQTVLTRKASKLFVIAAITPVKIFFHPLLLHLFFLFFIIVGIQQVWDMPVSPFFWYGNRIYINTG